MDEPELSFPDDGMIVLHLCDPASLSSLLAPPAVSSLGFGTNMLIFGTCVGGSGDVYRSVARPSLERVAHPTDLVLETPGDLGICHAYNGFIDRALNEPNCGALVLLHDDVELIDPNFRAKVLAAVKGDGVGVVGVVGGRGLRGLAWWDARWKAGAVFESRRHIGMGPRRAEVDVVDGLLMVLTPAAFGRLRFDETSFPRFHGYDADFCLQARSNGLKVMTAPIDVFHRTQGGYGDSEAFDAADRALSVKWPTFVQPDPKLGTVALKAKGTLKKAAKTSLRMLGRSRATPLSPTAVVDDRARAIGLPGDRAGEGPTCPLCEKVVAVAAGSAAPLVVECPACGIGLTWPLPRRDVEGDGLWVEMYGDRWLQAREVWNSEAKLRVEWLQLLMADGCLLEVGCRTGEFVRAAADEGYDAYGVEVSHWAAEHATGLGVDITKGYLSDWRQNYPGMRPDVVAMWHVLEHVPGPLPVLKEIANLLGPGGLLLLEVPNFGSTDAKRLGVEWDGSQPQDHFHHFHPAGLAALLERAGFGIAQLQPMSRRIYTPLPAWRSEQNEALLHRRPWPPLDLLRAAATVEVTRSPTMTVSPLANRGNG